mmetsp:Transcript_51963/g.52367  ORF Transcript_51963/g.52367 Transcript_51963/m.52367 type:complete len:109 (+) Transcript_51963:64-390(+)
MSNLLYTRNNVYRMRKINRHSLKVKGLKELLKFDACSRKLQSRHYPQTPKELIVIYNCATNRNDASTNARTVFSRNKSTQSIAIQCVQYARAISSTSSSSSVETKLGK